VTNTDIQEVIKRSPTKWRTPLDLDARTCKGARSSEATKRKHAAKHAIQNLAAQWKKEAIEKARMEKECVAKEKVEQEQCKSE